MGASAAAYLETRRSFLRRLAVGGVAVATLPALIAEEAAADIFKPSAAEQKKLGDQAARDVLQKYREVKDSRARRFRSVGNKLIGALNSNEQNKWNYSFQVVESKEVNAFALPGGHMFMFTGLLDRIQSDDELAAVTGHEVGHVRAEHWARAVAAQQKTGVVGSLLLGLFKANRTTEQLAGAAASLYSLKFSRDDEYDADTRGLRNMTDAGYNPRGMIELFETLQKASGKGGPPEFLSTHPLTKGRVRRAEDYIKKHERE